MPLLAAHTVSSSRCCLHDWVKIAFSIVFRDVMCGSTGPPWVPNKVVAALARGIGFLPLLIYGATAGSEDLVPLHAFLCDCKTPWALPHSICCAVQSGVKGTPMPHRVPITVAVGAPLEVPHMADPTREQVGGAGS